MGHKYELGPEPRWAWGESRGLHLQRSVVGWGPESKTINDEAGQIGVLLAPGAAGGRGSLDVTGSGCSACGSVHPHPRTPAGPASQHPGAAIVVSVPQVSKLRPRQDEDFAPRLKELDSGLPFPQRPLCPFPRQTYSRLILEAGPGP